MSKIVFKLCVIKNEKNKTKQTKTKQNKTKQNKTAPKIAIAA